MWVVCGAMTRKQVNELTMQLLATYDIEDAGRYEKHMTSIARRWRSALRSKQSIKRIVMTIREELREDGHDDYGCGWEDLAVDFERWGRQEGWIEAWE